MSSEEALRNTPTISDAPLVTLKPSPGIGVGIFASEDISENTYLFSDPCPAVYMVLHCQRDKVCAWCFRYENRQLWNISFKEGGGMVFCGEKCKREWRAEYGKDGLAAYVELDKFVSSLPNKDYYVHWHDNADGKNQMPSKQEIDETWDKVEKQADLIRALRLATTAPESTQAIEAQKEALTNALRLPVHDVDLLFYLLSGVLCHASPRWPGFLSLKSGPPYKSLSELGNVSTAYLHFLAVLPPVLLRSDAVSRATFEAVLARGSVNSIDISITMTDSTGAHGPDPKREEIIAYGIWHAISHFNHSCAPTAFYGRSGRHTVAFAMQDVRAGQEMCFSYINEYLGLEDRRKILQDTWGFTCQCVKCVEEEAATA